MKSILLLKKVLGLAEMTSGLLNASYSLPERQAVKIIFFAPCLLAPVVQTLDSAIQRTNYYPADK